MTYRDIFNDTVKQDYDTIKCCAQTSYDALCGAISFDKALDFICLICAVDGSVSAKEHRLVADITGDRSGLDAFVGLVSSMNTAYMLESMASFIASQEHDVKVDAIWLAVCIYAVKGRMSANEEDFLLRLS